MSNVIICTTQHKIGLEKIYEIPLHLGCNRVTSSSPRSSKEET